MRSRSSKTIVRGLFVAAVDDAMLRFVPRECWAFDAEFVDFGAVHEALMDAFGAMAAMDGGPGPGEIEEAIAAFEQAAGVSIETDLIGSLGEK